MLKSFQDQAFVSNRGSILNRICLKLTDNMHYSSLVIFLICFIGYPVLGQLIKEEQISFGGSHNKPIEIEVTRNNNKIQFTCTNRSYYPYELELEFTTLTNLRPFIKTYKQVVTNGSSRLCSFDIADPTKRHDYGYRIKYVRGNSKLKAMEDYPYLLPLMQSDTIVLALKGIDNILKVKSQDTITAMRKGVVTALPDNKFETDRLSLHTLEVIHEDGTIAIYRSLDPERIFVKLGQTLIPGQPVGQISEHTQFAFSIYKPVNYGKLQLLTPLFVTENGTKPLIELETQLVRHPASIVVKELSRKQLNQYIKNKERKIRK